MRKGWRDGLPAALKLMVFRHAWTMQDDPVLMSVQVPNHVTLENVGTWLKQNSNSEAGVKYTVLTVATVDVFETGYVPDGFVAVNVESTVY